MTSEHLTRFLEQRPLEPFTLMLVDGRELHVQHPEHAILGRHALSVTYLHPAGQVEVVDAALVVSIRTIYPADAHDYEEGGGPNEGE